MSDIAKFTDVLGGDAQDRFGEWLLAGEKVLRDPETKEIERFTDERAAAFATNGNSLYTPVKPEILAAFRDAAQVATRFKSAISTNIKSAEGMTVPKSRSWLFGRTKKFDRIESVKFDHKLWLRFLRQEGILPRRKEDYSPSTWMVLNAAELIKGFDAVYGTKRFRIWAIFVEPFGGTIAQTFWERAKAFIRSRCAPGAGNRSAPDANTSKNFPHIFVWGTTRPTELGAGARTPDGIDVFTTPQIGSPVAWQFDAGGEPDEFLALLYPEQLDSQRHRVEACAFGTPAEEIARETMIPLVNVKRWAKR